MCDFKNIYSDRYDPEYLKHLVEQLDINVLKEGALYEEKEINGVVYHRCISIDFCGIGASTLFFTNINEDVTDKNIEARREVSKAFRKIFEKKTLSDLNNENIRERFYLKVRFCFAYMHSDYPICLMKAEQKKVWEDMIDMPMDYYLNLPLSKDEFKNSEIRISQEQSLRAIIDILQDNDNLIILGGKEKKANTIQVRFSCIPSTVCTLIINETAYSDPYLYAKLGKDRHLSLNHPVVISRKNSIVMPKAFASIRKHFNYLWRHDLTMFCGDATGFRIDNKEGLANILSPDLIIGDKGTNWAHKERRIWEKKEEEAGKVLTKTDEDIRRIDKWKINLNRKLSICTRKIGDGTDEIDHQTISLNIGMKRKFFYFKIEIGKDKVIFEYLQPDPNFLYCVLAHYSYAKLTKKVPILHNNTSRNNIKKDIKVMLNHHDLDKNIDMYKQGNGNKYFSVLFDERPTFRLTIEVRNIHFQFDELAEISKAYYTTSHGKKSCLDF